MRRKGATMMSLTRSPIHHVSQTEPYLLQEAKPPRQREVRPRVALTIVLDTAAKATNLKRVWVCSNAFLPRAYRLTSQAPASASSVFPVAMPIEVRSEPAVVRFTRNAARKMPGQTRHPHNKTATKASPVGR